MTFSIFVAKFLRLFIGLILALIALALILMLAVPIGFYGMALYLEPTLPSVTEIKTANRQVPLQIYSNDNLLIGQYGNKISLPVTYDEIPDKMVHALLAAEDAYFFEHSGISVKGLGRAVTQLLTDDDSQTGGSTITMQVAKNYFLTPEQTFERKLKELFLSRKIEEDLSKDEILTLYVNKIYLGEGAYGIQAAAKKYYSKSLETLTVAETAMLAGLPKAPSKYNPVVNPERALERRNWILGRMFSLGHIDKEEYAEAVKAPIGLAVYTDAVDDEDMEYQAEMARISLVNQFGPQVMNSGWRVRLTIDSKVQHKADSIVRRRLMNYDRVRGWRGAEATAEDNRSLKNFQEFLDMHPAKVTEIAAKSFKAELKSGEIITVPWSGMNWARKHIDANRVGRYPSSAADVVNEGDIIRVSPRGNSWKLVQVPKIQASLVSLNPKNGAVVAAVGGFHFKHSKFNRATDGWRQPGSTIKPLIYSAALEKGYLPTSIIEDSPLRIGDWRPKNSDGQYYGPMELRTALYLSRNLVSIRLLQSVGMANARNLLDQFGLDKDKLPTTLSLALGTGQASPLQMATAYAAFANGGHRVQPYLIEQIYNFDKELIYQASPDLACAVCFNDTLEEVNEVQRLQAKLMRATGNDNFNDVKGMSVKQMEAKLEKIAKDTESENSDKNKESTTEADDKIVKDSLSAKNGDEENSATDTNKKPDEELTDAEKEALKKSQLNASAEKDRLTVYPAEYRRAEQAQRILSPSVAYEMAGILKDVIDKGTATKAKALGRADIGGKTGTTNNFKDAWFAGFHPTNVTVVWMGFDTPSTLGKRMYGGKLALPVWMDYMRFQLRNTPSQWVTLDNDADSEKKAQKTIEITDEGSKKSTDAEKLPNSKLPTGIPFRRPIPIAPARTYQPTTSRANNQGNKRITTNRATNRQSTRPNLSTNYRTSSRNQSSSKPTRTTTNRTTNTTPPRTTSKVTQNLNPNKTTVYTPPKRVNTGSTAKATNNNAPVYTPPPVNKPVVRAPQNTPVQPAKRATSADKPLDVIKVDKMPPMPSN